MVSKLTVAEYMRDVALHTLLGPYGIPIIGVQAAKDAYEGDYSGVPEERQLKLDPLQWDIPCCNY